MAELISMNEVEAMIGMKRNFIYKQIKEGSFPPAIKFGNTARWKRAAIVKWLEDLG